MEKTNVEIERKFVIEKPPLELLTSCEGYTASDITQIYLTSGRGITRRIRKRVYSDGRVEYTETSKIRIDKMSSNECEREIDEEEFSELSRLIDSETSPVLKTRYTFCYLGQLFEVDVYPEWKRSCIMEAELPTRDTELAFPDFIRVIAEVTGDKRYSNASMSRRFPEEIV